MSVYVVRHDNTFDNPDTWVFASHSQSSMFRDMLNRRDGTSGHDDQWRVEEEPVHTGALDTWNEYMLSEV